MMAQRMAKLSSEIILRGGARSQTGPHVRAKPSDPNVSLLAVIPVFFCGAPSTLLRCFMSVGLLRRRVMIEPCTCLVFSCMCVCVWCILLLSGEA